MKCKKILPILLVSASLVPYTSGIEKNESQIKTNILESSNTQSNQENSISAGAAALLGFGVGATLSGVAAGLTVRSMKNKEIEEEKSKFEKECDILKHDYESLEKENKNLKEQLKDLREAAGFVSETQHNNIVNRIKSYKSKYQLLNDAKKMWEKIRSTSPKGNFTGTAGAPQDMFEDMKHICNIKYLTDAGGPVLWNLFLSLVSVNEFLFEQNIDESVKNVENYDQTNAASVHEDTSLLKSKLLSINP